MLAILGFYAYNLQLSRIQTFINLVALGRIHFTVLHKGYILYHFTIKLFVILTLQSTSEN